MEIKNRDSSLGCSDSGRRGTEQASLLHLELVKLGLAVHLDDERYDEDKEGGACNPGGLSGALEELFAHDSGLRSGSLAAVHYRRLIQGRRNPR